MNSFRCVIDTNVLISAAIQRLGKPRQALTWVVENGILLVSIPVLEELKDVLSRKKFDRFISLESREALIEYMMHYGEKISITETITDNRDDKDNKFLELAVCGHADYLISGDPDLKDMKKYRRIMILSPADFLTQVQV